MANNCWLHNSVSSDKSEASEAEKSKLETKEIIVNSDYDNNLKIIFSPDKQELDQEKLLKDIESWKAVSELEKGKSKALQLGIDKLLIEWEVHNFNELNNKIQEKEQRILALRLDRDDLLAKLSERDNRIAQLDQILKGSALIFQTQQQIIDDLIDKLEVEKSKNTDNTDYQQHLQTDIKRLAGERKELSKRIKELEGEETKNKTVRDQELENLREEIKNLEKRPDITTQVWNDTQTALKFWTINFPNQKPTEVIKELNELEKKLHLGLIPRELKNL